jgi:hypothetical protein
MSRPLAACCVCNRSLSPSDPQSLEPIPFCPDHLVVNAAAVPTDGPVPARAPYSGPGPSVSYVLLRADGLTSSSQCWGWRQAAMAVVHTCTRDRARGVVYERIFLSAGKKLEEHTEQGLRDDLAAGRIPE